ITTQTTVADGDADASVTLSNSGGALQLGTIATQATGDNADARVQLSAGTGISVGSIATAAHAQGESANSLASIDIAAKAGALTATGALSTVIMFDQGTVVDGGIRLSASGGDIHTTALSTQFGGIDVSDVGGNVVLGNLTTTKAFGNVRVRGTDGLVTVGDLNTFGGPVQLDGGTGLQTGNLIALSDPGLAGDRDSSISLSTLGGTLHTGNISASADGGGSAHAARANVSLTNQDVDGHGAIVTGNITVAATGGVSQQASISIDGSYGNGSTVNVGNLSGSDAAITVYGKSIQLGTLSGNGGTLGAVLIDSRSTLTLANNSLTAQSIDLTANSGNFVFGDLTTTHGALSLNFGGGSLSVGQLVAVGGSVELDAGAQLTALDISSDHAVTLSGTQVSTHDIVAAAGISIDADSGVGTGDLSGTMLSLNSGGTVTLGDINTSGDTQLSLSAGNLKVGDVSAAGLSTTITKGNQTLSNLHIGAHGYHFGFDDIAGQTLIIGNINEAGAAALNYNNLSLHLGNISGGSFSASSTHGQLTVGNITSSGVVNLASGQGLLKAGNVSGTGAVALTSAGALQAGTLAGSSLTVIGGGDVVTGAITSPGTVSLSAGGDLTGGNVSAARLVTTLTGGNETLGDLVLGSGGYQFNLGDLTGQTLSLGNLSSIAGGAFEFANASLAIGNVNGGGFSANLTHGQLTVGNITSSGAVNLASGQGLLEAGNISGTGAVALTSVGALQVGTLAGSSLTVIGGGDVVTGAITSPGIVSLSAGGDLSGGNISAARLVTTLTGGNEQLGDLVLGSGGYQFNLGDLAGQTLSLGNLSSIAGGALHFTNASLTVGDVSGGAFSANLTHGQLSTGDIDSNGDVALAVGSGMLAFGNISGHNLSLSSGHDLALSNRSLDASGALLVDVTGAFSDSGSQLRGQMVALTATTTLALDHSAISGAGGGNADAVTLSSGGAMSLNQVAAFGDNVHLTSGGDLSIDNSQLGATTNSDALQLKADTTTRLQLDSAAAIHLANSTALSADQVALTAVDVVDASGAAAVNAGALSVKGSAIDLHTAVLTIGSGLADFGSDPAVLARLNAVAPELMPGSPGPNASFAASGNVSIGSISLAGGYLFVQSAQLALPTPTGPGAIFINYLPSSSAAAFALNTLPPPNGITTIMIGGSSETGDIQIGDGAQNLTIGTGTNFVFATQGITRYPDAVDTSGRVVVLGESVSRISQADLDGIPLDDSQYRTEQLTQTVNAAGGNGDLIEIHWTSGLVQACSAGGAP
ncbi:MAG: filamentous hemagglutinin N-terminal protein, partial [Nevskia sp.]|nr:filamentous hemagglutinin N-terminal protein [Nevskia sp.]